MRNRIDIDLGNALVKDSFNGVESSTTHALAIMEPLEFRQALSRAGTKKAKYNFIQIEDNYYICGKSAEAHNVEKRQGRQKYTEDYYVPIVLSRIAHGFAAGLGSPRGGVDVLASHAPNDNAYSEDIINGLKREWSILAGDERLEFKVRKVETFDEPFGGYNNVAISYEEVPFKEKGVDKTRDVWEFPLEGQTVGVIDIGGGTVSMLKISSEGAVLKADNGYNGINGTLKTLEGLLLHEFRDYFRAARQIPAPNLREALRTGMFCGKGDYEGFNISEMVSQASINLLNELKTLWMTILEGGFDLDKIILTGGGSAIFEKQIRSLVQHQDVQLAAESSEIHFANIRGAALLKKALESLP